MARAEGALRCFDQRLAEAALPRRWPTAMEAADIVVTNDHLRCIAETVRLSRRAHAVLWQNIALALGIKAVFADMAASLLVVFNGLRLLRGREFTVLCGAGLLSSGCSRSAIWPRLAGADQQQPLATGRCTETERNLYAH